MVDDRRVPDQLSVCGVLMDPEINLIPVFLTAYEMAHLLNVASKRWRPSVVGRGGHNAHDSEEARLKGLNNARSASRTSHSCLLQYAQTQIVKRIEDRVAIRKSNSSYRSWVKMGTLACVSMRKVGFERVTFRIRT